jgi:hypothetical protein
MSWGNNFPITRYTCTSTAFNSFLFVSFFSKFFDLIKLQQSYCIINCSTNRIQIGHSTPVILFGRFSRLIIYRFQSQYWLTLELWGSWFYGSKSRLIWSKPLVTGCRILCVLLRIQMTKSTWLRTNFHFLHSFSLLILILPPYTKPSLLNLKWELVEQEP